ncbi:MAG TPA: hypothetical protein VIP28_09170 [Nocardioides sp.]
MAHIQINRNRKSPAKQLIVNGVDLSMEVYDDIELVEVGEGPVAEVGLQITIAVSRLDLDAEADVKITDRFRAIAQRVRSIDEDVD